MAVNQTAVPQRLIDLGRSLREPAREGYLYALIAADSIGTATTALDSASVNYVAFQGPPTTGAGPWHVVAELPGTHAAELSLLASLDTVKAGSAVAKRVNSYTASQPMVEVAAQRRKGFQAYSSAAWRVS